jgi:hypothetical protein
MKAKQDPLFAVLCAVLSLSMASCVDDDPRESEAGESGPAPSSAPYLVSDANGAAAGVMESGPDGLDGSADVFADLDVQELVLRRPDGFAFGLDVDGAVFGLASIPADQELYFGTIACAGPALMLATVAGDQPTAQTCPSVALDLEPSEAGPLILLGWGAMPGMLWGVDVEALTPTWTDIGSILSPDGECFDVPALAACLVKLGNPYPIAPQLPPPFAAVSL